MDDNEGHDPEGHDPFDPKVITMLTAHRNDPGTISSDPRSPTLVQFSLLHILLSMRQ